MTSSVSQEIRPTVALMTDFGSDAGDVGVMKGVIAGIAPAVHIIDITHDVAPQNIASGAWILGTAYRYFPTNTVFVCVVDPGVGSSRQAIALAAGAWFFVGPDNGLFSYVLAEQAVHEVVTLSNPAYHLPQVSSTFHGRDIFAPVGAHLALKTSERIRDLGTRLDPADLQRLDVSIPIRHGQTIEACILHIDHFGNLITSIPLTMVPELFNASQARITFPDYSIVVDQRRRFFADDTGIGNVKDAQAFIYGDSSGYVAIAIRNGNAAKTLGVDYGARITFDTSTK